MINYPIILLVAITIINCILVPFGMLWNLGKSIYESFKYRSVDKFEKLFNYWGCFFTNLVFVFNYLCWHIAFAQDLFLNVCSGELIEDCITTNEDTLFGVGDCTVSAAIGREQQKQTLLPFGKKVSKVLDKGLGNKHCYDAILTYEFKKRNNIKY